MADDSVVLAELFAKADKQARAAGCKAWKYTQARVQGSNNPDCVIEWDDVWGYDNRIRGNDMQRLLEIFLFVMEGK